MLLSLVIKVMQNSFMSFLQGVGTVVSGTTLKGVIHLNDTLLLGPDAVGNFSPLVIKSIHRKRMPVKEVRGGQTASFSLKKVGLLPVNVRVYCQCHCEFYNWVTGCWRSESF